MTTTDWILDITLLLLVLRQLRVTRIDRRFWLLPTAIITWVAHSYLHGLPTGGNDLALIVTFVLIGTALGIGGGLATRVWSDGQGVLVKATGLAAVLWVLGMGSRMAFSVWSSHGGAPDLASFSAAHHITSGQAWVTAFVLMAFAEVGTRLATILIRAQLTPRPEFAEPAKAAAVLG